MSPYFKRLRGLHSTWMSFSEHFVPSLDRFPKGNMWLRRREQGALNGCPESSVGLGAGAALGTTQLHGGLTPQPTATWHSWSLHLQSFSNEKYICRAGLGFPFPNCRSSSREENSPLIGSIPAYISNWKYKENMGKEKSAVQHER